MLAFGWLRGIGPRVTQFLMIGATVLLTFIGVRFILQGLGVI